MKLILGRVYNLSGSSFSTQVLEDNNNLFWLDHIDQRMNEWRFKGLTTGDFQLSSAAMIRAGEAEIFLVDDKPKRGKRKKGPSRKAPSVNKATILFMSGETYTVKDFVSIEATPEKVVFIMEDNWKDTVNYRQAITVPNDDVVEVKVRGINHQFLLDMSLTNTGYLVWQQEGMEIILSELTVRV